MTKEEAERLAREWILEHSNPNWARHHSASLAALLLRVAGEGTPNPYEPYSGLVSEAKTPKFVKVFHLLQESARNQLAMGHSVHCFSTRHAGHTSYRCDCGYEQAREALRAASSGEKGGTK
jgi:hypothetical protein